MLFFFFNDTATTEIYTLSLHDALPIFAVPEKDLELWPTYDAVRCPTLVLRGELSDLLSPETAAQMTRRGPKAKVIEIDGVGHAPTLMHANQIAIVRDFLLEGEAP